MYAIPFQGPADISTPVGTVVHTGDFKFDNQSVDGEPMDIYKIAELGHKGVLALRFYSTNAARPGSTLSELVIVDFCMSSRAPEPYYSGNLCIHNRFPYSDGYGCRHGI